MKNVIMRNNGAGWYAPRQDGRYEDESVEWYWVGGDYDFIPDVYIQCLGTPVWFDDPAELEQDEVPEPIPIEEYLADGSKAQCGRKKKQKSFARNTFVS